MIRIQRRRRPCSVPSGVWQEAPYRNRRWVEKHIGPHTTAPMCKGRRAPRLPDCGAIYTMPRAMMLRWTRRKHEGAWR